ncbi:MAG: transcriptional regulator [Alphaproteobacteria bacterium]|nr:transcriptional regulator [Alphaproteobacteria bacterium]
MRLRPLRNESDYDAALAAVERLWNAPKGSPAADRLDLLVTLIEAYEARHWAIDPPDPIDAIAFAMDRKGISRKDLEPFIGSRARVADILNRRRRLTMDMARRLHRGLGIPAEVLLRPTKLKRRVGTTPRVS